MSPGEGVAETATDSETTVVASKDGCCGKCASEAAAIEQADRCCGGCVKEDAVATLDEPCGDCTACAEGDSESCKCADADAVVSTQQSRNNAEASATSERVPTFAEDRDTFHFLLANHEKIERSVKQLDNGVETLTESSDPEIVAKLQEHVASMYQRLEDVRPIRMRDPLYRELFQHTEKIVMTIKKTSRGIQVIETSDDEYVARLIKAHAEVVSGFVERGFAEARKNHQPPKR